MDKKPSISPKSSAPRITLCLAGINVELHTKEEAFRAYILKRYGNFIRKSAADFQISIESASLIDTSELMYADLHYDSSRIVIRNTFGVTRGEIDLENQRARLGTQPQSLVDDVEYFLRVLYSYLVFEAGGFLFHAAGIESGGYADLFFGKSGSGKTTIARASGSCNVLNDDLVAIVPEGDQWIVCGTPFWSPTQVAPVQKCAPLSGVYRLVQDSRVFLERISFAAALGEVFANVPIISGDPYRSDRLLSRCQTLLDSVPVLALHFLPDDSFWPVVLKDRTQRIKDYPIAN